MRNPFRRISRTTHWADFVVPYNSLEAAGALQPSRCDWRFERSKATRWGDLVVPGHPVKDARVLRGEKFPDIPVGMLGFLDRLDRNLTYPKPGHPLISHAILVLLMSAPIRAQKNALAFATQTQGRFRLFKDSWEDCGKTAGRPREDF